jgi:hypothetical protein
MHNPTFRLSIASDCSDFLPEFQVIPVHIKHYSMVIVDNSYLLTINAFKGFELVVTEASFFIYPVLKIGYNNHKSCGYKSGVFESDRTLLL